MTFLESIYDIIKRKDWLDDINFMNNSKEYVCLKDYNKIVKNQKVLIVNDKDNLRYSIVFIINDDLEFVQILYKDIINLSDFFELSRTLKVEKILNELWVSGMK